MDFPDNDALDEWFKKQGYNTKDQEYDLIYVNGESPPSPVPETDCADSWSMNYFGICQCMNETVTASLSDVTMYMFLDNSGSMNGGTPDLWDSAVSAVTTFVQDPASAAYNVAWRMFGSGCCDNSCSTAAGACATPQYGPDFLSNITHQNDIIGSMPANAPGGCGTPIYSAGPGVVVASGQPLMPWDTGYGVVVDHGNGIQTWYWHMQPRVIVAPGTIVTSENVIGYEGTTGMSTGCHVHFAVNDRGVWENPRNYLP